MADQVYSFSVATLVHVVATSEAVARALLADYFDTLVEHTETGQLSEADAMGSVGTIEWTKADLVEVVPVL